MLACAACGANAAGYGAESDGLDPIRDIYLKCRHPGGPMSDDDLLGYAKSHGFSDAEMAAQLVALAQILNCRDGTLAVSRLCPFPIRSPSCVASTGKDTGEGGKRWVGTFVASFAGHRG